MKILSHANLSVSTDGKVLIYNGRPVDVEQMSLKVGGTLDNGKVKIKLPPGQHHVVKLLRAAKTAPLAA